LYECETWSLILREKHRLKVFENRVLRIIFVLKRDEETRMWRKLNNEELNELYSKLIIVWVIKPKRMGWAVHVASMERRGVYRFLVEKLEGKRPLGRTSIRWEDNINP